MSEMTIYQEGAIIKSYNDVESVARAMVASGFFTDATKVSQAIVKIMAGNEIGIGPFGAMNGIHIIQGKPAFGANIMASKVKASRRYNYRVTEMTDANCTIEFMEHFNGAWQTVGVSSFSRDDAKKAGTKNLDKFPRNMLFSRAISNGVRWYCPDVMNGSTVYTPEELGADVDQDGNVIDGVVTPNEVEPLDEIVDGDFSEQPLTQAELSAAVQDTRTPRDKWARPMKPAVLKEALEKKFAVSKPATENQVLTARILLINYFGDREDERHQATEYLTGYRSTKDVKPEQWRAIIDWMKPEKNPDGSGDYIMNADAQAELSMVASQYMAELGQESLL